jgi:hypothetical protein
MPITPFNEDLDIIQALSDEPNDDDGLTADELKAKFDEAGNHIKGYINERLIPDVAAAVEDGLAAAKDYADEVVIAVGAADMAKAIYDPTRRETDIFAAIDSVVDDVYTKPQSLSAGNRTDLGLGAADSPADAITALTPRFGTCTTAAGTVAKVATVAGFKLFTGATVSIRFTNDNTAATPTLNVNGTGAAPMYSAKTQSHIARNDFLAAETTDWVYNGAQWVLLSGKPNGKRLVATFTASGTFYPADYGLRGKEIDAYLVGGGGGGWFASAGNAGGGGGGGHCVLVANVPMINTTYPITIGAGGAGATGTATANNAKPGGETLAFNRQASGGGATNSAAGGAGGSGGGEATTAGGARGNNGGGVGNDLRAGKGAGATLYCPVNPYNNTAYGGGGGGGAYATNIAAGLGGEGGGGQGGGGSNGGGNNAGRNGTTNTGGGGGGGGSTNTATGVGGNGGSGIVLIYA